MKNIIAILSFMLVLVSCETDNRFDKDNYNGGEAFTYFTGLPSSSDDVLNVNIENVSKNTFEIEVGSTVSTSSDRTYTLTPGEGTPSPDGSVYSFQENSVTINAGEYKSSFTVEVNTDGFPAEGQTLEFQLEGPDVASYQDVLTVNIVVVLPVPADRYVDSEWNYTSTVCAGDGSGGCAPGDLNYQGTVTMQAGDSNNTFIISDITGGLYAQGYGDDPSPAELYEINGNLFLEGQPDQTYAGDEFNGTGSIVLDDNRDLIEFTISWSNSWGDGGVNVYTKN